MDFLENVRRICKEKGTTIAQVERECGLANGIVSNSQERMSADRLSKIAGYLQVSMEELLGMENYTYYTDETTSKVAEALHKNKELALLFDAAKDCKPEDLITTYNVLIALKRKEWENSNDN